MAEWNILWLKVDYFAIIYLLHTQHTALLAEPVVVLFDVTWGRKRVRLCVHTRLSCLVFRNYAPLHPFFTQSLSMAPFWQSMGAMKRMPWRMTLSSTDTGIDLTRGARDQCRRKKSDAPSNWPYSFSYTAAGAGSSRLIESSTCQKRRLIKITMSIVKKVETCCLFITCISREYVTHRLLLKVLLIYYN